MAQALTRNFVGKGRFSIQAVGGKLFEIGNVDKCSLSAKVDTDKVLDYTKGGGGVAGSYSMVSDANISISVSDFNANNLALALLGTTSAVASGTVTGEAVIANKGGLVPLAKAGASSVVVTHTSGTPTYAPNVDYQVTGAGIMILAGGAITEAQALKVNYAYPAQTDIQMLTSSGQEYRFIIDGLNDAESGKVHVIEIYRWKPEPTSGLDLIGDKMGRLQIQGQMLADAAKTGAGISKYARMTQVD